MPGIDLAAPASTSVGNAAFLAGCPHFLVCGGCTDVSPKDDRLPAALAAAGYAIPAVPLHVSPPNTRRRMDLAIRRTAGGVELGLHRHRSHDIVDLHTCRVLHPDLVGLFDPLRETLNRTELLAAAGAALANRVDNGIDLLLRTDHAPTHQDRTRLADFAGANNIARVSHAIGSGAPETIALLRRPVVTLSGVAVHPAPGAFLQATPDGQAAIVAAVLAGLPRRLTRRSRIAELYAGSGTLTFALAPHARIDAYEADPAAHAALDAACRAASLTGRVTPHLRDLIRQPLLPRDLAAYDAVVLDPPAAGAAAQIRHLADARMPTIIYVSCSPATLAADAARLRQAGYALHQAAAVDQFIGAPIAEAICTFTIHRPKPRLM